MSLIGFIKDAGEKLFGHADAKAAPAPASPQASPAAPVQDVAQLNAAAGQAIERYIEKMGLKVEQLHVAFDGASGAVTVAGQAPDQATREKVVLCCGNVQHVSAVHDEMTVAGGGDAAQYYTVVKGDTLSKISKQFYDTPNKYPQIFEANKPMLSDPDKIYPGQVLRIPPAG